MIGCKAGEELESCGIASLERFDWTGGFFGLGFEMDCWRTLSEEVLPAFVEYSVHDTGALDSYEDEAGCTIEFSGDNDGDGLASVVRC